MRIAVLCAALLVGCTPAPTSSSGTPRVLGPPALLSSDSPFAVQGEPFTARLSGVNLGDSTHPGALTLVRTRDVRGQPLGGPAPSQPARFTTGGGPDTASASFDAASLDPGIYAAVVRNAQGVEVRFEDAVLVLPRPRIAAIDHRFVCSAAGAATVKLSGSFFHFDTEPLAVRLDRTGYQTQDLYGFNAGGCTPIPFLHAGVNACTEVAITLDAGALSGEARLTVVIPRLDYQLAPHGEFDLARVIFAEGSGATPPSSLGLYSANAGPVMVPAWNGWAATGGEASPSASIGQGPLAVSGSECTPSSDGAFQVCHGLGVLIPQGAVPGVHVLDLTTASGCRQSASVQLAPVPAIERVSPAVCANNRNSPGTQVIGTGFARPQVFLDGQYAPDYGCSIAIPGTCALIQPLGLSAGNHTLLVTNQSTPPVSSAPFQLQVFPGPPSVGLSPVSLYAGATRQIFLQVSALTGGLVSAVLAGSTGRTTVNAVAVAGGFELTYPALGVTDVYSIEISDQTPCTGRSGALLIASADPAMYSFDFGPGVQGMSTRAGGPPVTWVKDGNPGGAAQGASAGIAGDWYFRVVLYPPSQYDAGLLRFDLRARGSGTASAAPGLWLEYSDHHLEHALAPPPAGVWTHYEVRLDSADGWTYRDAAGNARPATLAELRADPYSASVLGSWWPGNGDTAIDNLAEEYAR